MSKAVSRIFVSLLLFAAATTGAFAQTPLAPGSIQVSRIQYDGNTGNNYTSPYGFPEIFNDQAGCNVLNDICNIAGIEGSVYIDQFSTVPATPVAGTLSLPSTGAPAPYPTVEPGSYLTSSFSSKSEGALMLSTGGNFLTYMGYEAGDQLDDASNGYSPNPSYQLVPNTYTDSNGNPYPFYDREVALIGASGLVSLTPIDNAYSGDNPRAAITVDGNEFYMSGNSDSTEYGKTTITGPGLTIGSRCGIPASSVSYQLGTYVALDRPDESAKKHIKDNNWRGVGIYTDGNGNPQLYVSKGSGGNGDDGVFQVGSSLPVCVSGGTDTNATITPLFSAPVTNQNNGAATPYLPFGFWFANPTTLYVADEGNPPSYTGGSSPSFQNSTNGTYTPANDPYAGLEKWSLVNGTWTLDYTIQAGLNFDQPQTFAGYNDVNGAPLQSYTYGIRNMTGFNNGDGTVTIYAITAQFSAASNGESDPDSLVGITDSLAATTLPGNEQFVTLQTSAGGEVFRGVAYIPPSPGSTRTAQTVTFPNPGPVNYGVSPITLTATATSGWPVAYTLISGPATLAGNVLTVTGAGTVVVQANQSGNTQYAAATASINLIVNEVSQTISFTIGAPATATYGNSFAVAASATSGLPVTYTSAGSCTNFGALYTITSGSGTCTVTANQAGNSNYSPASPVSQFTGAVRANPTVTFTGAPAKAPFNSMFNLIATTNSSAVAFITATDPATCSLSGSYSPVTVAILKDASTCKFTATWGADANYNPASATQQTAAEKAVPAVSWETPAAIAYGTPLSATQLDATSTLAGTFTYSPAAGAIELAGNDTLKVVFKPTDTNYSSTTATTTLQVLQATTATTITSNSSTVTLNKDGIAGATLDFNVTSYKPMGAVTLTASTGEVCSGTVNATGNGNCKLTFTTTGTRTIIASYEGDGNHLGSNNSTQTPAITVTVNQ